MGARFMVLSQDNNRDVQRLSTSRYYREQAAENKATLFADFLLSPTDVSRHLPRGGGAPHAERSCMRVVGQSFPDTDHRLAATATPAAVAVPDRAPCISLPQFSPKL